MTDLQKKLLEMLSDFHDICEDADIKYYLLGGSALGAVRHNGFIPWDDDIDVALPRPDYEKLRNLSKTKYLKKYQFEFPGENKDFIYPHCKMYDTSTTLIEHNRYNTKRGIFIDIFPLDGIGNTYNESLSNFKKIDRKINLLWSKSCALRKGRAWYKNLSIIVMRVIPDFIINFKNIMAKIEKICKSKDYYQCTYIANVSGNWHEKEISEREWFGTPTLYDFENIKVYCPENVEAYLTTLYGDWRKLPPKEQQVTHHDYAYLDLNKSYLD